MKKYGKKQTKIVATLGPASSEVKDIMALAKAGMNVARLNFSHGTHTEQQEKVNAITKAVKQGGKRIAILQDLSGPKIRTGEIEGDSITLVAGKKITLTTKTVIGNSKLLTVSYKKLPQDVKKGARILVHDGKLELVVLSTTNTEVVCKITRGGTIRSRRGINLPGTTLSMSVITAKDKKDLEFGVKNKVDFMALSFVQTAKDILDLKKILKQKGSKAMVVAKIETTDAIENIDEIVEASDAIMVARGDLAVEVGPEKVPMLQKKIIAKCNAMGKPVIVATQMLETMITEGMPTRAEVSDVSNAILDGADAVMLSEETAMGNNPERVVKMMASIAIETEDGINYKKRVKREYAYEKKEVSVVDAITRYAVKTAYDTRSAAIVAYTETGSTSRMVARFRSGLPIVVVSSHEYVLNQSLLSFGAYPALARKVNSKNAMEFAEESVKKRGFGKKGDSVVVTTGSIFGKTGETNTITVGVIS